MGPRAINKGLISHAFSKFSQNCLSRKVTKAICTSNYLFITQRAKFCTKAHFQGLAGFPAVKNRLAVEWRKPATVVRKTLQVQFTQSDFFRNKTSSNVILFTCFDKLATGVKVLHQAMKDVNKCPNEL